MRGGNDFWDPGDAGTGNCRVVNVNIAPEQESRSTSAPFVRFGNASETQQLQTRIGEEDLAIATAVQRGNSGSAEALYRRVLPFVRRTLWRILPNPSADCDDFVQITFERLIDTVLDGSYRGDCSLPRWAMSIAARAAIDHYRARVRERRLLDEELARLLQRGAASGVDGERLVIARSDLGHLQDTLLHMRPLDARAIVLRHGFGFSTAETAAALGTSEDAVASRLMRARRELLRRTSSG